MYQTFIENNESYWKATIVGLLVVAFIALVAIGIIQGLYAAAIVAFTQPDRVWENVIVTSQGVLGWDFRFTGPNGAEINFDLASAINHPLVSHRTLLTPFMSAAVAHQPIRVYGYGDRFLAPDNYPMAAVVLYAALLTLGVICAQKFYHFLRSV